MKRKSMRDLKYFEKQFVEAVAELWSNFEATAELQKPKQHLSGCDGRIVTVSDSQPHNRGFESRRKQLARRKPSRVSYGLRQWCLGSLSHKCVPGHRQRWQLYLDYPWRLEACIRGCILPRDLSK